MVKVRPKETISLGTAVAAPGRKGLGVLPLGHRPDGSAFEIPVILVSGAQPGPNLWVQACIHGDEYDGAWALVELANALDPAELSGTLIAIPVLNVGGFQARQRTNPLDGKDLNRVFPGNPGGTITEQIAHGLMEVVTTHADALIDLHGGGSEAIQSFFPLFHHDPSLEASRVAEEMSPSVGSRLIWRSTEDYLEGDLFTRITRMGIPAILIEYGGGARLTEQYIAAHREGITRVMRYLRMLPGEVTVDRSCEVVGRAYFMYTVRGGFFRSEVEPMQHVQKGQVLDRVFDVYGREVEVLTAPADGIGLAVRVSGTCYSGSIAHVFAELG